jgi:hypothetical protein
MLVIGKRQSLEGRISHEGLRFNVDETVTGEVHCLQLGLFQEGFLMDVGDVVPGRIQLHKRNYCCVPQGSLVYGRNLVVGNVEILHVAVKPEINITIPPVTRYFILRKVLMYIAFLSYFCAMSSHASSQKLF